MFVSQTAKSLVWLLRSDPDGWTVGSHSICHAATRIGLWTANGRLCLSAFYNIPKDDILRSGHVLSGREVQLSIFDKYFVWRWIKCGVVLDNVIPQKISDYATQRFDQHQIAEDAS